MTERRIMVAVAQADLVIVWALRILAVALIITAAAVIILAVLRRIIDRHKYNKILRDRGKSSSSEQWRR